METSAGRPATTKPAANRHRRRGLLRTAGRKTGRQGGQGSPPPPGSTRFTRTRSLPSSAASTPPRRGRSKRRRRVRIGHSTVSTGRSEKQILTLVQCYEISILCNSLHCDYLCILTQRDHPAILSRCSRISYRSVKSSKKYRSYLIYY